MGNELSIGLGYDTLGTSLLKIQQGPMSDAYKMKLSVKIFDSSRGCVDYKINQEIIVLPNNNIFSEIMTPGYNVDGLFGGNTQDILKVTNKNIFC